MELVDLVVIGLIILVMAVAITVLHRLLGLPFWLAAFVGLPVSFVVLGGVLHVLDSISKIAKWARRHSK